MKQVSFNKIKSLISWITCYWFPNVANSKTITETWLNQVKDWQTKSGQIWTIQRVKDIRLIYTKYISGEPFKVFPGRIGLNAKGLPKSMPYFNSLIESNSKEQIQFVLTLLSISRVLPGTKDPSTSTITDPSTKDSTIISELTSFIPTFFKNNGIKEGYQLNWSQEKLRLSNKAGPEGRATLFSWRDAVTLPPEIIENINIMSPTLGKYLNRIITMWPVEIVKKAHQRLKVNFKTFCAKAQKDHEISNKSLYGNNSRRTVIGYEESVNAFNRAHKDSGLIRKLSIIEDPEAKARVIAIFDYWSQEVLKGIHDLQFRILKENLSQDRTFTQDPIISDKEDGQRFHSVDLSAATDRFPIEIQTNLIESLFKSREFARAWQSILIDHEFYVPWNSSRVKYNTGQPMGAYSSWSTFAICHHLVVAYAGHLAGYNNFKKYILLGDDIVIYNDDVANHYKIIMARLGVDCSPHKTHTSLHTYEFAKRWFHKGQEITGIQLRGFLDTMNKYHLVYQMVMTLYQRGITPRIHVTIPDLILSLFKRAQTYSRMRKHLLHKVEMLHSFRKFIDENNYDLLISKIKRMYPEDYYLGEGHREETINLINTYIYVSANKLIQRGTADAIKYETGLLTGPYFNKIAEALANPRDLWTSPTYLIISSPLYRAVTNRLEVLVSSLAKADGDIKDMIKVIALPDPAYLEQRQSERIINAEAALASKFFDAIQNHTYGRPHFFEPNLSASMARSIFRKVEGKILNRDRYLTHGLI